MNKLDLQGAIATRK